MACSNVCKLCNRIRISTDVTFDGANLVITIPEGSYNDGEKYCLVVAQNIPNETTINAPVYIQIGAGTEQYPLTKNNCSQQTASGLRTRTRYATRCVTTPTSGSFRLLGSACCTPNNDLQSINGTTPTTVVNGDTNDTKVNNG